MTHALLLVLVAACGSKGENPTSASGSMGSANGSSGSDAITKSSPIDGDPAYAVIERAFHNKRPAFPLLSSDGGVAAVEIVTPIGQSGGSTYSVGFVRVGADAWSGAEIELTTLVDAKLAHLLLDSMDTSAVAKFDVDAITKLAAELTYRIREEGFRRFDTLFDAITVGELVSAGPFRFKVTNDATGAISIAVSEGSTQVATEQLQPVPMGRVGDTDCIARPVVKRAFSDVGRRRLLLHVGWNAGPDRCQVPDDKYRLVAPR